LKGINKIILILLSGLLLAACSRKKNTFLNRNVHAVSAEYNALYNGGLAFELGKEELSQSYSDNFWEILPVERLALDESKMLPGATENANFNRAEEKSILAIQKHAIYIDGKEHNPQIDEAYMLLGKSRYYDARFVPALDAFNFILNKYPTSNNINNAKVWKAKTNIRLNNEEVALEDLQKMFRDKNIDDKVLPDVAAIMAQAYINLDSLKEALPYMKLASSTVKDNELKGRYAIIKGQLYNRLGERDSANLAFDEVIALKRKSPRVYLIVAHIGKAKNFNYESEDRTALLELLFDLEGNRENRPYLDKIYNQIGEYYRNTDSIDAAVYYYNQSIKFYTNDRILQSINYQTLAEINFDNAEYKIAGSYYDSTLTNLVENSRQWRLIKKKRENLDDVIKYEDIATLNDSILRIANMSENEQIAFFTRYTQDLKNRAIKDSIANVNTEQEFANNEFYKKEKNSEGAQSGGNFYFYNSTTVSFGRQEFRRIWGDRKLEDNWRLSSKKKTSISDVEKSSEKLPPIAENDLYKVETYLSRIPKEQIVIDSIAKDRNFAYYQLGLIYKEKFREYTLAANRLEKLLTYNPEERLILPAKYNLIKIYEELGNTSMASFYRDDILNFYADSRYAEILRNPYSSLATDESSPEFKYKQLYKDFENSEYEKVIEICDQYMIIYNGNDIIPKLELLKATTLGRQQGFDVYKKSLSFISLNYPNTDEGKQAQEIYTRVLPQIASKEFLEDEASDSFKIVYQFNNSEIEEAKKLQEKLESALKAYNYTDEMSTSMDYYVPGVTFVIVHGLNTKLGALGFADVLKEHKVYKIKKEHFEISSANYKIIQIHKNLTDYLNKDLIEQKETNPQK